jgi:cytosine/adenosine deaminase-related metal-dependent hydrolase
VEENERFLQRVADGRWPLARGMVGAHASFSLSEATLASCVDLAQRAGTGLHIHAAEDAIDQADAYARFGRRTVDRLRAAGGLTGLSLLAHAVHIDQSEAALIRSAGATVVHNPRSNMNNGVGRTPIGWLQGHVALGTDGIGADMFEEGRAALLRRREEELDTDPILPLQALARGAGVVGRSFDEPLLGTLQPGAPADIVILDYAAPTTLRDATLASHWEFGISSAAVRDVLVGGEPVVRDRQLVRLDSAELTAEARQAAKLLWERIDAIGPHPFSPSLLLASAGGG